ncbi:hypothetical protein PENTCL1PPCAC_8596, partial [Pristionchus entomophagus]
RMLGAYGTYDDSGELQSVYHITAYCGRNLRDVLDKEQRYTMKQLKSMMSDLLRACKYLNLAEIIHRDVKPENMCIDENWKLTLLDFGLARVIDKNNQMTAERGTHPYMSIEMLKGWTGNYDERVDVWSIGAILCELISGQIFFHSESAKISFDVAIEKLGPIPESVLDQIGDVDARNRFRKKSQVAGVERMDFSKYLLEEGLSWLADDIRLNEEHIIDFIDYALQFSPEIRMSVDEALAHPLLKEVRNVSLEAVADSVVPEEEPLPEDKDEAMVEVKRRIKAEIDAAPRYLE